MQNDTAELVSDLTKIIELQNETIRKLSEALLQYTDSEELEKLNAGEAAEIMNKWQI